MSNTTAKSGSVGRRLKAGLAAAAFAGAALLGTAGVADASQVATTTVSGAGTVSYNGELTRFTVNATDDGNGNASGTCTFDGASGTTVRCTSFYDFRLNAPNKVTTRGTATLNGRPISFTAVLTDEGAGNRDSYTLYTAGRVIGGKLISGDITISSTEGEQQ